MLTKLCAIVSGLAVGGFLFFRYSRLLTHNFSALTWYEAALLFTGLGLAGLYPRAWLGAVLSTALAAFLGVGFQVYLDLSRNPKCCNLWPLAFVMWFFLGLPAPLIGGVIGYTISFKRVPRLLFLILLASGLGIGLCLPLTQQNGYRRIGTKEIPALLARIYEAEISYNAKRADKSFNATGTSYRRRGNSGGSPAPPTALGEQRCQAVCTRAIPDGESFKSVRRIVRIEAATTMIRSLPLGRITARVVEVTLPESRPDGRPPFGYFLATARLYAKPRI